MSTARRTKRLPGNSTKLVRFLLLAWAVPLLLSFVVYYGFSTNYTTNVFSEDSFKEQYESGIYRYRILGRMLLLRTNELIEYYDVPTKGVWSLQLLDPSGTPAFYTAYFVHNTLFLCLAVSVLFFLVDKERQPHLAIMNDLALLLMTLLMLITQYVVVPYDTLSYFWLAVAMYLILVEQSLPSFIVLCTVVVLATFTRESAVLILAFYFAVNHSDVLNVSDFPNKYHVSLIVLLLCFLAAYVWLRFTFGFERALFQVFQIQQNLSRPLRWVGFLSSAALASILLLEEHGRKQSTLFLLASSPYAISLLFVANLWEVRLWIPILIPLVVLKLHAVQRRAVAYDAAVTVT